MGSSKVFKDEDSKIKLRTGLQNPDFWYFGFLFFVECKNNILVWVG